MTYGKGVPAQHDFGTITPILITGTYESRDFFFHRKNTDVRLEQNEIEQGGLSTCGNLRGIEAGSKRE